MRIVALVAASELFLRMVRMARLSADRDRSGRRLSVGMARAPGASLHVLAAGLCLRHSAARRAHAANARRRIPRLSGAHQRLFPVAVTRDCRERRAMNITAAAIDAGERLAWPERFCAPRSRCWSAGPSAGCRPGDPSASRISPAAWPNIRSRSTPERPTTSTTNCRRSFSRLMLGPQRKYSCCYYEHPATRSRRPKKGAGGNRGARGARRRPAHPGAWLRLGIVLAMDGAEISRCADRLGFQFAFATRVHQPARRKRGLRNLTVHRRRHQRLRRRAQFDRVVSVEMFEHMSNWRGAAEAHVSWLTPEGALFIHVFSHLRAPYRFDAGDPPTGLRSIFSPAGSCRATA